MLPISLGTTLKQYRCSIAKCNLVFDKPSKLSRHELLHCGIRNYSCPTEGCGKSYSTPSHLNRHMKSHQISDDVKPLYRCSYSHCESAFHTKWGLRRHEKNHDKDYCELCKLHFRNRSDFEKHVTQHVNRWSQICEKCGKNFTHTSRQKYLMHKNRCGLQRRFSENEFECDRCRSHFKTKKSIRQHVIACYNISTSLFVCGYPICSKIFNYRRNLSSHIYRHHLGIDYKCPEDGCTSKWKHLKYWKKHLQNHGYSEEQIVSLKKEFTNK